MIWSFLYNGSGTPGFRESEVNRNGLEKFTALKYKASSSNWERQRENSKAASDAVPGDFTVNELSEKRSLKFDSNYESCVCADRRAEFPYQIPVQLYFKLTHYRLLG